MLFSGQTSLPDLVAEDSAGILVVLVVAKGIAYAISLSCGFRGGPVFPAIFLGVALAMLAVVAFDVSPTLAVAVGATAGMVAMTRLVIALAPARRAPRRHGEHGRRSRRCPRRGRGVDHEDGDRQAPESRRGRRPGLVRLA